MPSLYYLPVPHLYPSPALTTIAEAVTAEPVSPLVCRYWDEVELARCIYQELRLNCSALDPAPLDAALKASALSASTLNGLDTQQALEQLQSLLSFGSRFNGQLHSTAEWERYEQMVDATDGWQHSPAITLHKVSPARMHWLEAQLQSSAEPHNPVAKQHASNEL